MTFTRPQLETLYVKYNARQFVSPDPLEVLYHYDAPEDREVVGLIASGLAYGRVNMILKSVDKALLQMGSHPRQFVLSASDAAIRKATRGFQHRFTTALELQAFVRGIRRVLERYGTIENCVFSGMDGGMLHDGLCHLADIILSASPSGMSSLLPHPARGSACKRLHLYTRWLVRCDNVDPGGWTRVKPSQLTVPLDTHMYRVAVQHGMTARKSADLKTALEITLGFARLCPEDPVRYDFALTRAGIHGNNRKS